MGTISCNSKLPPVYYICMSLVVVVLLASSSSSRLKPIHLPAGIGIPFTRPILRREHYKSRLCTCEEHLKMGHGGFVKDLVGMPA